MPPQDERVFLASGAASQYGSWAAQTAIGQQRGSGRYPIDVGVRRAGPGRPLGSHWCSGSWALPLYILLYVLRIVAVICAFIGWFVALFTAQLPEGLGNLIAGYYRLYWRTTTYAFFLREKYPSFALSMGYPDPSRRPGLVRGAETGEIVAKTPFAWRWAEMDRAGAPH